MDELKTLYLQKLGMTLSIENTIIEHLPTMIGSVTNADLKEGLSKHLEETRAQRERLNKILANHGKSEADMETDEAFAMMIEDAGDEIAGIEDTDVRDAAIIAAAQVVEHIEIARYGTLIEWAKQLDDSDAESMLKDTLGEEKGSDSALSKIAEGGLFTEGVNEKAAE